LGDERWRSLNEWSDRAPRGIAYDADPAVIAARADLPSARPASPPTSRTRARLELLSELVPQAKVIALLVNPNQPTTERDVREVEETARAKGLQLLPILKAGTESEIDTAFATLVELHAGALFLGGDPFFFSRREQFLALASRHAVPAIYTWREFTARQAA
jgi:ABC-type uncharacterized transport system substrate-binding protein